GSWVAAIDQIPNALLFAETAQSARVRQSDAKSAVAAGGVLSTDPPYYDNIGYSDLSDFFYVWLRRTLTRVLPGLVSSLLVPKQEDLVANSYRFGGPESAKDDFESGFEEVFANAFEAG